jgi:CheY-like chemotaxis protein
MTDPDTGRLLPGGARERPGAGSSGTLPASRRQVGVLAVDDQACVRGVLEVGLRQLGFAVWPAGYGREAVALYRHHRAAIDVVLLDVRMPVLDGPQTLAALRAVDPHVCCCFMSGDLGAYTEVELRGLGAAAVLPKPFDLAELAQMLRRLAGRAGGDGHPPPTHPLPLHPRR